MEHPDSTCWTIIEAAGAGGSEAREFFARRYGPTIRAYLSARWRSTPYLSEIEDAIQDVFMECFKQEGLLSKADRERGSGFRTFLFGATRIVALRVESKRAGQRERQAPTDDVDLAQVSEDEAALSAIFDKAWAKALLREAAERQRKRAEEIGEKAVRRIELLRLRFEEGLPIRDIAEKWQCDAAILHHEYARARQEYKEALMDVVAFYRPGTREEVERECASLLTILA